MSIWGHKHGIAAPSRQRSFAVICPQAGANAEIVVAGISRRTDARGIAMFTNVGPFPEQPDGTVPTAAIVRANGWPDYSHDVTLPQRLLFNVGIGTPGDDAALTLPGLGVDPSTFTLEQLARIRCSIWTARLDIPYGPRPNAPDNILAMDFIDLYDAPTRARMIAAYKARGYTHTAQGPFIGDGYHGQYPDVDYSVSEAKFNEWLDIQQELWNGGVAPIVFLQSDPLKARGNWNDIRGWLQLPRAQRLIRIVCYRGWEPGGYEMPTQSWVDTFQEARAIFPNALQFIHMPQDMDAPNGGDSGLTNAQCWQKVAPYLHGWLVQIGGYIGQPSAVADDTTKAMVQNYIRDLVPRFKDPSVHGDWPKSSAWGEGRGLKVYLFEDAAYQDYWGNWPEAEAVKLGDWAIEAGADGYGDGGTVAVP